MTHNHDTKHPPIDTPDLQRLIIEAAVLKRLYAAHAEFKEQVAANFTPGDKRAVKNPQGLALGSVSMSAPNKKATCEDRNILLAMADEQGREIIDGLPTPDSDKGQALIAYLAEHAPEFLDSTVTPDDYKAMSEEVLEQWQITGTLPAGWGISDASAPRFSVTPGRSKPAQAAITHLVREVETVLDMPALTTGEEEK